MAFLTQLLVASAASAASAATGAGEEASWVPAGGPTCSPAALTQGEVGGAGAGALLTARFLLQPAGALGVQSGLPPHT